MSEQKFAEVFGAAIQKQMDQDMGDMCSDMARTNSHARNVKITPAYEHVDVFERQRFEHEMRLRNERIMENNAKGRLIQPDDPTKPKVRVIMPNE